MIVAEVADIKPKKGGMNTMFIFGIGLGMVTASVVMAVRLFIEAKPKHRHITVDDDDDLPPFIRNRLAPHPKQGEINSILGMLHSEFPDEDWSKLDKWKR